MKVLANQRELKKALDKAALFVPKHHAIQALTCVELVADPVEKVLMITGTDIEVRVMIDIPVQIEEPGKIVMNLAMLRDIVKNVSGIISINNETVTANNLNYTVETCDPELFPNPVEAEFQLWFNGPLPVNETVFATAPKDPRPFMHCVKIENDSTLRFVATDANRLIKYENSAKVYQPGAALIHADHWKKIGKIMPEAEVMKSDKRILFHGENLSLSVPIVDASYPKWQQLFDEFKTNGTVEVENYLLRKALEDLKCLKARITIGGYINLEPIDGPCCGQAVRFDAKINSPGYAGIFPSAHIIDFLKVSGDTVTIKHTDKPTQPMFMSCDKLTYLVMPCKP